MRNRKNILIRPHVTEKATVAQELQKYVFKVCRDATKNQIKSDIEKEFTVKITKINVINMEGKVKRFGKITGKKKDWKKAYITLAEGHSIDLSDKQPKE